MVRKPSTVVCTSDLHGKHDRIKIPEGDVIVFAGDMCNSASERQLVFFNQFLGKLPHRHKIVVGGNNDLSSEEVSCIITNGTYINHGLVDIDGLKIWGTSYSYWLADDVNRRRSRSLEPSKMWDEVPERIDMLVTHFPPHEILDLSENGKSHEGVKDLAVAIKRIKPSYHIFGHVHARYGITTRKIDGVDVTFVNVAANAGPGFPMRAPVVLII